MSNNGQGIVFVLTGDDQAELVSSLAGDFSVFVGQSKECLSKVAEKGELQLIVLDHTSADQDLVEVCREIKSDSQYEDIPIVLYSGCERSIDAMSYFDAGVDDIVDRQMPKIDLMARLHKSIFHTIASRQLKSRLKQANEMAFSAMSDTSDLGANIQFLVHCHDCSNLDELAMLLFRTLNHYQLSCSVQFRSEFETKNCEESGLAKDLESRLLWELKDEGRYVDFGHRCVMNYGQVSVLVKNMPDDEKRFGTLKDNVFPLLQGAAARIKSIDSARMLEIERDLVKGMSTRIQNVMEQVDERYQQVMRQCADVVEDMAVRADEAILFLDLTEAQEETFSNIMREGVKTVSELFNEGIKIDESFRKLIEYLNAALYSKDGASVDEMKTLLTKL